MNFSNTMYLFSAYSVVCAAVVYFAQTMMLGRFTTMGEFSVAGLIRCAGITLTLAIAAHVLSVTRQKGSQV
jgi:hypothetical protein